MRFYFIHLEQGLLILIFFYHTQLQILIKSYNVISTGMKRQIAGTTRKNKREHFFICK